MPFNKTLCKYIICSGFVQEYETKKTDTARCFRLPHQCENKNEKSCLFFNGGYCFLLCILKLGSTSLRSSTNSSLLSILIILS